MSEYETTPYRTILDDDDMLVIEALNRQLRKHDELIICYRCHSKNLKCMWIEFGKCRLEKEKIK